VLGRVVGVVGAGCAATVVARRTGALRELAGRAFCFRRLAFAGFGASAAGSASVRSWIFGTSVLVGSLDKYDPATARGTKRSAASTAYFTGQSCPGSEKER
jgi:hypothetical protein